MKVCIHHGAVEIGGNCIEIEAGDGSRLLLDLGMPLGARSQNDVALPPVRELPDGDDPSLLGVVISRPHMNHVGLLHTVSRAVYVG